MSQPSPAHIKMGYVLIGHVNIASPICPREAAPKKSKQVFTKLTAESVWCWLSLRRSPSLGARALQSTRRTELRRFAFELGLPHVVVKIFK